MNKFTIKKEHILLCQRMWVEWNDDGFGAPTIDQKRPYGNSDVLHDIVLILDPILKKENFFSTKQLRQLEDGDYDLDQMLSEKQIHYLEKLHHETQIVLQIILLRSGSTLKPLIGKEFVKRDKYDDLSWVMKK